MRKMDASFAIVFLARCNGSSVMVFILPPDLFSFSSLQVDRFEFIIEPWHQWPHYNSLGVGECM